MKLWRWLFGSGTKAQGSAQRADTDAKPTEEVLRLIASLQHSDSTIRLKAVVDLHRHPGEATVSALIKALKDGDAEVRGAAAESLRLLRDPRAVEPLIEVLETDTEHSPVYFAINALGYIRTPNSIEALVSALERGKGDLSTLAFQLGEARAKAAVEPLIGLLRNGTPYERRHAAMALGNIGDRRALESLRQALNDSDEGVRERAANAVNQIR